MTKFFSFIVLYMSFLHDWHKFCK